MTTSNAVELFREGFEARRINTSSEPLPTNCGNTFDALRQCLGTKTLAINLDESGCDTKEFRANCTGRWRRYFIEQTYREQVNQLMYKQEDLDRYALAKTNYNKEASL